MNSRRSTLIATLGIVLAAVVSSSASALPEDPPPLPPVNLEGEYNEDTEIFTLSWDPPPLLEEETLTYNVYRNGELVDQTSSLSYSEELDIDAISENIYAYQVTTLMGSTQHESAPSTPVVVTNSPICIPVSVSHEPEEFPFIFFGVDHACMRGWERFIADLIPKSSAVDPPQSPID